MLHWLLKSICYGYLVAVGVALPGRICHRNKNLKRVLAKSGVVGCKIVEDRLFGSDLDCMVVFESQIWRVG